MKHLCILFSSLFLGTTLTFPALGQITRDGTTNTTITPTDNGFQIDDGDVAGGNLFHSFRDFSVPTGREAFFNNADNIVNIFSRVTGGNISNIDGLIRANGSANLYLINPAGIMFGSNASLQLGGSFYGSTADTIIFPDGEFSATNLDNPPLITINAPIGLGNVRDNGGDIVGQSVSLAVAEGQNITFKGNNILFDGGFNFFNINAPGGNVTFEANKDINLINGSILTSEPPPFEPPPFEPPPFEPPPFDPPSLEPDPFEPPPPFEPFTATQAVDIPISSGNVVIRSGSAIQLFNTTIDVADFDPSGQTGNITIEALNGGNINLISDVFSTIFIDSFGEIPGTQTGGNLNIIGGEINIDGYQLDASVSDASNGGNILIIGDSVTIQNRTSITTDTMSNGNAGNINITVTNNGAFNLSNSTLTTGSIGDFMDSGDAGDVNITAGEVNINESGIGSNTFTNENAGDVNITAGEVNINESDIGSGTFGEGNAGNINIIVTNNGTFNLSNSSLNTASSGGFIDSGDAGDVNITAGEVNINESSSIFSNTFTNGNAGDVNIIVTNNGAFNLSNSSGLTTASIGGFIDSGDAGDAGDVNITAGEVNINESFISSNTSGEGNAGDVNLTAGEVNINNESSISSNTSGEGNAGNINIIVTNNGTFNLSNSELTTASSRDFFFIDARGDAGDVNLTAGEVNIQESSAIFSDTSGEGNAGNINIIATDNFSLIDSEITSNTNGQGNAGNINITARQLLLRNATINAGIDEEFSFDFLGVNSELFLFDESGNLLAENALSDPSSGAGGSTSIFNSFIQYTFSEDGTYIIGVGAFDSFAGEEGIVGNTIPQGENYTLQVSVQNHPFQSDNNGLVNQNDSNNSLQSAQNIDNDFTLTFDPNIQDSDTIPHVSISATGDGTFDYYSFEATQGSTGIFDIDEISNLDNINLQAGTINITATGGNVEITNSNISTSTIGRGNGGNININSPNSIILRDNSQISTEAFNNSNGGNININVDFIVAFPNQNNDIIARAEGGTGGNITINAVDILGLEIRDSNNNNNNTNDIDNISEVDPQLNGILEINTTNVDIRSQVIESPENFVEQETVTQVCSVDAEGENSSFIVKGKGGVPSAPNEPLSADLLLVEGETITPIPPINSTNLSPSLPTQPSVANFNRNGITPNNAPLTNVETISKIPSHIKPLKTSQGDIYPARGIIKTEDGRVILTAYPTDISVARTSNSGSCHPNSHSQ